MGVPLSVSHCAETDDARTRGDAVTPPVEKVDRKCYPKSGCDQWICYPRAFKLGHLQPVKLILSHRFSTFLLSLNKAPLINHFLLPQREEGRTEQGLKMGKGNSSKVNETQGFVTLGHSNWAIYSLLN